MGSGCESCEANLMAEIEDAAGEGEELNEDVQAVLEGDKEAPFAYGPLSDWEGPYCKFCHGIGHVLAFVFAAVTFVGCYLMDIQLGYAIAFSLFLYGPLAVTVLYIGRFPLLGAMFGPWVEMFLGKYMNVYVTKKAEKEYGSAGLAMDGGQREPMRENIHGPKMHVVAEPWAVENCAEPDAPGALVRVEIEETPTGPRIVDRHNFDPEVNYFQNTEYHIDPSQPTVCHTPEQQRVTTLDFDALINSRGEEGVSRE